MASFTCINGNENHGSFIKQPVHVDDDIMSNAASFTRTLVRDTHFPFVFNYSDKKGDLPNLLKEIGAPASPRLLMLVDDALLPENNVTIPSV